MVGPVAGAMLLMTGTAISASSPAAESHQPGDTTEEPPLGAFLNFLKAGRRNGRAGILTTTTPCRNHPTFLASHSQQREQESPHGRSHRDDDRSGAELLDLGDVDERRAVLAARLAGHAHEGLVALDDGGDRCAGRR